MWAVPASVVGGRPAIIITGREATMALRNRSFLLVLAGFAAGAATVAAGFVVAAPGGSADEPSDHAYVVSIDEIRSNLVPGQVFSGQFTRRVTMSDGSTRVVTLRPVRQNGEEWVELIDTSASGTNRSYMGPNGTTTNGTLMINVKDAAVLAAAIKRLHESSTK
jgi:hypothetical protein